MKDAKLLREQILLDQNHKTFDGGITPEGCNWEPPTDTKGFAESLFDHDFLAKLFEQKNYQHFGSVIKYLAESKVDFSSKITLQTQQLLNQFLYEMVTSQPLEDINIDQAAINLLKLGASPNTFAPIKKSENVTLKTKTPYWQAELKRISCEIIKKNNPELTKALFEQKQKPRLSSVGYECYDKEVRENFMLKPEYMGSQPIYKSTLEFSSHGEEVFGALKWFESKSSYFRGWMIDYQTFLEAKETDRCGYDPILTKRAHGAKCMTYDSYDSKVGVLPAKESSPGLVATLLNDTDRKKSPENFQQSCLVFAKYILNNFESLTKKDREELMMERIDKDLIQKPVLQKYGRQTHIDEVLAALEPQQADQLVDDFLALMKKPAGKEMVLHFPIFLARLSRPKAEEVVHNYSQDINFLNNFFLDWSSCQENKSLTPDRKLELKCHLLYPEGELPYEAKRTLPVQTAIDVFSGNAMFPICLHEQKGDKKLDVKAIRELEDFKKLKQHVATCQRLAKPGGQQGLLAAIRAHDLPLALELLQKGVDPNQVCQNPELTCPLLVALEEVKQTDDYMMIALLETFGASFGFRLKSGDKNFSPETIFTTKECAKIKKITAESRYQQFYVFLQSGVFNSKNRFYDAKYFMFLHELSQAPQKDREAFLNNCAFGFGADSQVYRNLNDDMIAFTKRAGKTNAKLAYDALVKLKKLFSYFSEKEPTTKEYYDKLDDFGNLLSFLNEAKSVTKRPAPETFSTTWGSLVHAVDFRGTSRPSYATLASELMTLIDDTKMQSSIDEPTRKLVIELFLLELERKAALNPKLLQVTEPHQESTTEDYAFVDKIALIPFVREHLGVQIPPEQKAVYGTAPGAPPPPKPSDVKTVPLTLPKSGAADVPLVSLQLSGATLLPSAPPHVQAEPQLQPPLKIEESPLRNLHSPVLSALPIVPPIKEKKEEVSDEELCAEHEGASSVEERQKILQRLKELRAQIVTLEKANLQLKQENEKLKTKNPQPRRHYSR